MSQAARPRRKILFITRAYPPVVGGIEQQNYQLQQQLARHADVELWANTGGKRRLPWFFLRVICRLPFALRRCDLVLLGDGVLAPVGWLARRLGRRPVVCIIHGLDVTYPKALYQRLWVRGALARLDALIAVGRATRQAAQARGIADAKLHFIPNGVAAPTTTAEVNRAQLAARWQHDFAGPVLLTLGRLVRRKGVAWFIEHVLDTLAPEISYLVAGDGPQRGELESLIRQRGLQGRVLLLGAVSEADKALLLAGADLFVQPNIAVAGDIEGFGLVVLEAAAHGTVVVAARLEGLADAIEDGTNGYLVQAGAAAAFRDKIETLLKDASARRAAGLRARDYVLKHQTWAGIARRYLEVFEQILTHH